VRERGVTRRSCAPAWLSLITMHGSRHTLRPVVIVASMSHFSSRREKRLWLWALAVVAAVYSTLGLAGSLAGILSDRGLLNAAFALAFLVVVVAIVGNALKVRAGRREMWTTIGVTAVYGMVVIRMGMSPAERTHLFEYGLLAVLIHEALLERRSNGRQVRIPAVLTVIVTALLGWLDESIQGLLPNRVYDLRDVGINALAGLMGIIATLLLAWACRWDRSRRRTH
jgi:MFS family permease